MKPVFIAFFIVSFGGTSTWGDADYETGRRAGMTAAQEAVDQDSERTQSYLRGVADGIRDVLGGGGSSFMPGPPQPRDIDPSALGVPQDWDDLPNSAKELIIQLQYELGYEPESWQLRAGEPDRQDAQFQVRPVWSEDVEEFSGFGLP